jgi:hypothetical protein
MDRKRKANNAPRGILRRPGNNSERSSKHFRWSGVRNIATSNAWRAQQQVLLNQLIAQRAAGAQRAAAAGMVRVNYPRSNNTSENTQSRKRVSAENARTRSNSLRNRIALLNTLSALSNANLLARMQGPNKNNIEKTLLENNASLLQRIKRLQGLNNKAQDLEVLIKLRSYNNNKLFKDLFKWTTPQRQYITRILPLLNMPLWQKILSFDQAISRAQAQARAQAARTGN